MQHIGSSLSTKVNQLAQQKEANEQRRKRFQSEQAIYTTVIHSARKELGITINEYCLADSIHKLSSNPNSPVLGWCIASKKHLAKNLGFSRQSIHSMLKNIIEKGLVEENKETGHLRSTAKWYEKVVAVKENLNK